MLEDYLDALESNLKFHYPKAGIYYQIAPAKGYSSAPTVIQILFSDSEISLESSVSTFQTLTFSLIVDRKINQITNDALSQKAFLAQFELGQNISLAIIDGLSQLGTSIDNQRSSIEITYGDIGPLKFGEGSIAASVMVNCNITLKL